MKADKFFEILGDVDENKVAEADRLAAKPARPRWRRWAALAACLALVLAGAVFTRYAPKPVGGGGGVGAPNGAWPEGIDPIVASVAVFPKDTYTIYDVEDATITELTEAEACAFDPLGAYLPKELPEGWSFDHAMLYDTTMYDGTKYYMLRVEYFKPNGLTEPSIIDGETGEEMGGGPDGDHFLLFPTNYDPGAKYKAFDAGKITVRDIEKKDGSVFHVSYGDIYMGISSYNHVSAEDLLAMIQANLD